MALYRSWHRAPHCAAAFLISVFCSTAAVRPAWASLDPQPRDASPFLPNEGVILPRADTTVGELLEVQPRAILLRQPSVAPTPVRPIHRALEASFIGLQALDVVSTRRSLHAGYTEANPLMRSVSGHPVAFAAVKAGAAATTILLTRRVARQNRVAALATMAAINAGYAVVVVRNFRLSHP